MRTATAACLALAPAALAGALSPRQADFDYDALSLREVGARNTLDWRMWLEKDGSPISFWHDVPLYPDPDNEAVINMYVEIPRWTDGKIETKRDEPLNPIFHDDKKAKVRFVASVWPHKTYPFNYGSLPQTWEDSTREQNFTGFVGDNDPVDVFDIGSSAPPYVGQVKQVKILGALAMIDDEETDWKVIVVDVNDPLAEQVDSVEELDQWRPGMKQAFYDWFVYYKVVRDGTLNTIVGGEFQDAATARAVVRESHGHWLDLLRGNVTVDGDDAISLWQTSQPRLCRTYIDSVEATAELDIPPESAVEPPAERPSKYDRWYYLDDEFMPVPGQDIDV